MISKAVRGLMLGLFLSMYGVSALAAQYAAVVMDARDGKILHARSADTPLHPASLTKMMTLYLVFEEIRAGRMSLDQKVRISKHAASKPPSKLGLRAGQKIEIRYLIRAAAVKSANDAAAALAEAVSGSERAFARKMTAAARAMGMRRTTFKNASGLTQSGHMSTARDMAILGRQLFYDFPEYYNLFSRRSTSAKLKTVYNTNRRLLNAYPGADGIKTGYTRAAGYNLVSSAKKGRKRVIVSMFGGTSTAARNKKVAELMDLGFRRMGSYVKTAKPARPVIGAGSTVVASAAQRGPLKRSFRPTNRPAGPADAIVIATEVTRALAQSPSAADLVEAPAEKPVERKVFNASARAILSADIRPVLRPGSVGGRTIKPGTPSARQMADGGAKILAAPTGRRVGDWIVQLGGTHNRTNAEKLLLRTALEEMEALEGSKRDLKPAGSPGWYHARFVGLSQAQATAACARLAARQTPCEVIGTGG